MSFKEFLRSVAQSYFVIVTLILFATYLLGMMFHPDDTFTYEAMLSPLLYGLLAVLPEFVTYSKKELTVRQMMFRKVLQLVCLEAVLVLFGLGVKVLSVDELPTLLSFMLTVFVIFVLVHVIMFILDREQARQMNNALENFQKRHDGADEDSIIE